MPKNTVVVSNAAQAVF